MNIVQLPMHRMCQLVAHGLIATNLNVYLQLTPGTHMPCKDEAAILMFNHTNETESYLTPGFLTDWPLQMWAKEDLWYNWFLGAYLTSVGMIKVKGSSTPAAMKYSKKVLSRGGKLGVFGEGTRTDGQAIYKQRPGAARLALETGTSIFVFVIDGSAKLNLKDRSTYNTPIAYKLIKVITVEKVEKPTFAQVDALCKEVAMAQAKELGLPYVDDFYKKPESLALQ
jgi:1-acyl-sn-glycerol-3-phosphate acyltransferase